MTEEQLIIKQGSKFELTVGVVDSLGVPMDITGWDALMQIRNKPDETGVLLATYETPNELTVAGSTVLIDVPGADTALYTWTDGFYDLLVIDSGEPYCVIQGTVKVLRRVTVVP